MIEHRLLVRKQPIVTTVERVDVGKRGIGAKQVAERAPLEPVPMQSPLATRGQEPIACNVAACKHVQALPVAFDCVPIRTSSAPEKNRP